MIIPASANQVGRRNRIGPIAAVAVLLLAVAYVFFELFTTHLPWRAEWLTFGGPLCTLPNRRLKLAAPTSKGIHLFVNDTALRRSLSAIR